ARVPKSLINARLCLPVLMFAILTLQVISLPPQVIGQQAAKATLTGTVTDPNGAVVAGVTVTATEKAIGIRRTSVSNDEGLYVLSNLTPGNYELRIEGKGFITQVTSKPVSLEVGQTVTFNASLQIGVSESITI